MRFLASNGTVSWAEILSSTEHSLHIYYVSGTQVYARDVQINMYNMNLYCIPFFWCGTFL